MKRECCVCNVRVRRKRRQAQAHRAGLERTRSAVRDRRTVQPRAHGNAAVRKRLCQRLAVHIAAADRQHRRLAGCIRRRKHFQPCLPAQALAQILRKSSLPPGDIVHALRGHVADTRQQARDAGDIVRARLKPVGQLFRHGLEHAL